MTKADLEAPIITEKPPCKKVRRMRSTIEKHLERAHYKQLDSKECHAHGLFRASTSLNEEARRLKSERNAIDNIKKLRDDKARANCIAVREGKLKMLESF